MAVRTVQEIIQQVLDNVERVIIGKNEVVELVVIALLCQGHTLIEDVPGVGKTVLAKALARSLGCTFKRIQFTPDLLPSDVTGVSIYNQKVGEFEYRSGPVMCNILLADEINRATPKTQSSLLEAMEEHQVTVDGQTYPLPDPFIVLATQNPIEYEGTFPLPEAQLDRFLMRIRLGYPSFTHEMMILDRQQRSHPLDAIGQVLTLDELRQMQLAVRGIKVDNLVREYIVAVVNATRSHGDVYLGASPRGSLALFRTSQARAALNGRAFVLPDDIKYLAKAVLAHRIIPSPSARVKSLDGLGIMEEVLQSVPVPGARVGR